MPAGRAPVPQISMELTCCCATAAVWVGDSRRWYKVAPGVPTTTGEAFVAPVPDIVPRLGVFARSTATLDAVNALANMLTCSGQRGSRPDARFSANCVYGSYHACRQDRVRSGSLSVGPAFSANSWQSVVDRHPADRATVVGVSAGAAREGEAYDDERRDPREAGEQAAAQSRRAEPPGDFACPTAEERLRLV
jgi:hypothetical protein